MNTPVTHSGNHFWPSMRGDERNTGCSMHAVRERDRTDIVCIPTGRPIFSTPVIDHNERLYIGSSDKKFYAIDPLQQSVLWNVTTGGVIDSAACIDHDGSLYVPSGDASLYKLSADGQSRWNFDLLHRRYARSSTIFWWEGNAAIGPNGWMYAGNDDFYLYAMTPEGDLRWTFPTGLQVWSVPAFHDGMVYITSFDLCVYAIDQETGRLRWKRRLPNVIAASPAIDAQGHVYVGTFDGAVYALDGKTGKILWHVQTGNSIYASVAIAPDHLLYIGSGDGKMYCIDSRTGIVRWTFDTESPIWSSAVIGQDPEGLESYLVYVGTSSGPIVALDPSGRYRWAYQPREQETGKRSGVNASLALGTYGLATGTVAGDILYIPYTAYQHRSSHVDSWAIASSGENIQSIADVGESVTTPAVFSLQDAEKRKRSFRITTMHCKTPAIINPFDQIGLASLAIDVAIVRSDPSTGRCIAWGVQSFGVGETDHADGTLYPRRHFYAFSGERFENSLTLEAHHCDFDITAFPIPLDSLAFTLSLDGDPLTTHVFHAELNCHNLHITLLKKYGMNILGHIVKRSFLSTLSNGTQLYAGWRSTTALYYAVLRRIWRPWNILDEARYFNAQGTFVLEPHPEHTHHTQCTNAVFDRKKRRVTATFTKDIIDGKQEHIGILLIDGAETTAIVLDYGKHLHIKQHGTVVTATLKIPRNVDLPHATEAIVLVRTTVVATIPLHSASVSS